MCLSPRHDLTWVLRFEFNAFLKANHSYIKELRLTTRHTPNELKLRGQCCTDKFLNVLTRNADNNIRFIIFWRKCQLFCLYLWKILCQFCCNFMILMIMFMFRRTWLSNEVVHILLISAICARDMLLIKLFFVWIKKTAVNK